MKTKPPSLPTARRLETQRWRRELHQLWQQQPGRLLALLRNWLKEPPTKP
ncbi:hypothetical protein [Pseudaeromonas paramecii]|uniref:Uncharacterized protein n=1 Tax=Pseudaeromonas paramecii TaxID=2138166 RepID=A0ABP8Q5U1_9GAMM